MDETIYALSSGVGKAGIAVIRLSGPDAEPAAIAICGKPVPEARRLGRRVLRDPESAEILDEAMLAHFPGPGSYTGEDIVELHIHGGAASIDAVLAALARRPGLRLAEPGEFTRRAFANGKMDLTEVEGLADLIDAETAAQRRQALRQARGGLRVVYEGWAEALTRILAHYEAAIDFPDEDLPEEIHSRNDLQISRLIENITQHLEGGARAERLRRGVQIAIVGQPNVGKSSLLNRLAGRDAAIVSDRAGTTRDVIAVQLDLGGYPATLVDTAGIQETADGIELEGIRRARLAVEDADIVVTVAAESGCYPDLPEIEAPVIFVRNKSDLGESDRVPAGVEEHPVSAKTGAGLERFVAALSDSVRSEAGMTESPVLTRHRHREALVQVSAALRRALDLEDPVLIAEELREALRWLGRLTGRVDVEALLDVIFRDFCIGK